MARTDDVVAAQFSFLSGRISGAQLLRIMMGRMGWFGMDVVQDMWIFYIPLASMYELGMVFIFGTEESNVSTQLVCTREVWKRAGHAHLLI